MTDLIGYIIIPLDAANEPYFGEESDLYGHKQLAEAQADANHMNTEIPHRDPPIVKKYVVCRITKEP